jgi:hypothetical protein
MVHIEIGQIWEYVGESVYPISGVRIHNLTPGDRVIVESIEQFVTKEYNLWEQGKHRPPFIFCSHFGRPYRLFAYVLEEDFKLIAQSPSTVSRPGACNLGPGDPAGPEE